MENNTFKATYVPQLGQTKSGPPNEDEWYEIHGACIALIEKLGKLKWQDRDIAFNEYSNLIDALNARGTKKHIPILLTHPLQSLRLQSKREN